MYLVPEFKCRITFRDIRCPAETLIYFIKFRWDMGEPRAEGRNRYTVLYSSLCSKDRTKVQRFCKTKIGKKFRFSAVNLYYFLVFSFFTTSQPPTKNKNQKRRFIIIPSGEKRCQTISWFKTSFGLKPTGNPRQKAAGVLRKSMKG